jgi:hypothetical protein
VTSGQTLYRFGDKPRAKACRAARVLDDAHLGNALEQCRDMMIALEKSARSADKAIGAIEQNASLAKSGR